MDKDLVLNWTVGHTTHPDSPPERRVAAAVPGAANLDWAVAENWPDWKRDTNYQRFHGTEDYFWIYQTILPIIQLQPDQRLWLVSKGIDYRYDVRVDGDLRYSHEGMFSSFELDLSGDMGSELEICLHPAPKDPAGLPGTRQEAQQSCKPAVSYGWDWHPRLIPLGIWDETALMIRSVNHIRQADLMYELSDDLAYAHLNLEAEIAGEGDLVTTLYAPDGTEILKTCGQGDIGTLHQPQLWWCNGYGQPNLYRWETKLYHNQVCCDKKSGRIGFRSLMLEMNEGTWNEPVGFPKSRSRVPITIKLNGTPVFCKGSNWVNPEVFPGTISKATYQPLLQLAKDAHMNLLRVWGGGIVNKDSFFDLCDEMGLMVWQEFPLACNQYKGTKSYLAVLEQEARAIIRRLRGRASLALWCGGNELFNSWSKMTDQSAALRLLNKLCYELDPQRPYLATSPLMGMAHGCYLFRYPDGREVYQAMAESHYTAYTEFGVPSVSNLECCRMVSDQDNLFPLIENAMTIGHHAFRSWGETDTWACQSLVEDYFGRPDDLEQLIDWSQWLQSEGYKAIYEEARRQKPYCSMALNWCYNEPWPTLANNSLINYPATPKPAYHAVAASCREQLVSARIRKFTWQPGEVFEADLWLLNDGGLATEAGEVAVWLEIGGQRQFVLNWSFAAGEPNVNLAGPTVRFQLPELRNKEVSRKLAELNTDTAHVKGQTPSELKLILECGSLSSEYRLILYI